MPSSTSAVFFIFADATLQVVLVGAVAAILLIALALTLRSRPGRGGAPDGQAQSSRHASGGEAKKSAAPTAADLQPRPPALPGFGGAPTLHAPPQSAYPIPQTSPPPASSAQPAFPASAQPAPPATERDGIPISTPWEPVPAPQPSAEGYGTAAPVTGAPAQAAPPAPPYDAPAAPPASAPEPEEYPFAPSAGSASSEIDWDYMEREQEQEQERESVEREEAEAVEEAFALPPADEKRADTPTAEELAAIEPAAGGDEADDERLRGITPGGVDRQQADQAPSNTPTAASLQFTSFYPREVPTQQWQTLLVYTHIADALDTVRRDALKFAEELGERPRVMHAAAAQPVERGTTLTIVPSCAGVRFNPERLSLSWDEDWQRSSFRFSVADELAGSAAAGEIAVYVGPLILAVLKFGLLVSDGEPSDVPIGAAQQQQTVGPSSVFASYSHDDTPVVLACRNAYKALGLTVNIDVDALRSGDQWDPRLMQLIDGSDVFQLFWSARAAASEPVQREWRYALAHSRGAGYIRPVYWEQPLIAPPPELSNVHFAYIDLPRE